MARRHRCCWMRQRRSTLGRAHAPKGLPRLVCAAEDALHTTDTASQSIDTRVRGALAAVHAAQKHPARHHRVAERMQRWKRRETCDNHSRKVSSRQVQEGTRWAQDDKEMRHRRHRRSCCSTSKRISTRKMTCVMTCVRDAWRKIQMCASMMMMMMGDGCPLPHPLLLP